ncbi:helix-turn-helix domain-containing protein [Amycolatopsis sp. NPDC021455]|uniref:helix-turn-helix domain-containing protein n=1 Tax=Amycolatopsis sp. NPDC021455 TaxID=3154901 RepID=UPI0033D45F30
MDALPNGDPPSIRDMLAVNLRAARSARGLSLSELARRSGIGKATLSQLEAGTGNPTIETVFSLSRVLEVAISDLLDHRPRGGLTVVRATEVEVLRGEGVDLRPLRRIEDGNSVFEVYDQVFRGDAPQRSQGHAGVEHTIVQTGGLRVEVAGRTVDLGPGDYVAFDAGEPHGYTALTAPVHSVLLLQYRADDRLDGRPHPVPAED